MATTRKVKGRTDLKIPISVDDDNNSYTPNKKLEIMIAKGEELRVEQQIEELGETYYLIDAEPFGYPGVLLKIPKEAVTPVYPWQTLAIIAIVVIMLIWWTTLVLENNGLKV
ncbi:MAG: hypothetical protein WC389_16040 [Lutibacter sp.]|jgi:hypothetical protein